MVKINLKSNYLKRLHVSLYLKSESYLTNKTIIIDYYTYIIIYNFLCHIVQKFIQFDTLVAYEFPKGYFV